MSVDPPPRSPEQKDPVQDLPTTETTEAVNPEEVKGGITFVYTPQVTTTGGLQGINGGTLSSPETIVFQDGLLKPGT
jgi:hypothetical protein